MITFLETVSLTIQRGFERTSAFKVQRLLSELLVERYEKRVCQQSGDDNENRRLLRLRGWGQTKCVNQADDGAITWRKCICQRVDSAASKRKRNWPRGFHPSDRSHSGFNNANVPAS